MHLVGLLVLVVGLDGLVHKVARASDDGCANSNCTGGQPISRNALQKNWVTHEHQRRRRRHQRRGRPWRQWTCPCWRPGRRHQRQRKEGCKTFRREDSSKQLTSFAYSLASPIAKRAVGALGQPPIGILRCDWSGVDIDRRSRRAGPIRALRNNSKIAKQQRRVPAVRHGGQLHQKGREYNLFCGESCTGLTSWLSVFLLSTRRSRLQL